MANPMEEALTDDLSSLATPQDISVDLANDDANVFSGKDIKPDSEEQEMSWEEKRQKTPKIVDVKWLDFEHFKNRYSNKEGLEIIEVLQGHQHIAHEVAKEQQRRGRQKRPPNRSIKSVGDAGPRWIQRVRIQSPEILLLLSRLTGHDSEWAINTPRVFFQPFRTFYYYLPQMKECLKILEHNWTKIDAEGGGAGAAGQRVEAKVTAKQIKADDSDSDNGSTTGDNDVPMDPEAAVDGEIANSFTALTHVRKYIEFVEKEILPLWERAAGNSQRKVRSADLWMSFQPGELLYVPPASESPQSSKKGKTTTIKMYQTAWRLYSMIFEGLQDDSPDDIGKNARGWLKLYAYYIEYNGSSYGPIRHIFHIPSYEGERDITTLNVYPMRFVKDSKDKITNLFIQGQRFQDIMNETHLYYDGWTLTHGPTGNLDSEHEATSEHIDSDIIIDFAEGYKADSSLSPPSFKGLEDFDDRPWPTGADPLEIKHWVDESRNQLLEEVKEVTQASEWFAGDMAKRHRAENKFLATWEAGNVTRLDGDDLTLLPHRAVAYAFRQRKFVMVDIRALQKVPESQNAFKDLKIPENHKKMVKSLVKTHFQKQNIRRQQPQVRLNQDLIRGKGSGLVILLHGVPGVGKTATAEAVAQANKKPLFTITCGDLGFTPKEVETSLRDIFRLAHLWDCVLLLDEADIFLSRREVSDLNRNALVSVFLRVLEYYSGILFLTTNRVGSLDEAFKSRIHVSLYYPPLGRAQTLAIFGVNIRKLSDIEAEKQKLQRDGDVNNSEQTALKIDNESILHYAAWHYDNHVPHERWNGRQIRNAFQIAYSLAQFDMQKTLKDQVDEDNIDMNFEDENTDKNPHSTMTLNYKQFQVVANAIERFDAYLYDAIAGSDMDNARNLLLRADDHNPAQWNHGPTYRPPSGTKHQSYTYTPGGSQQGSNQVRPGPQKGQYNNHSRSESRPHPTKRQEYQPLQQDPRLPLRQQRRQGTPQKENLASQEQLSQLQTSPEPQLVQRQGDNLRPPGQRIGPNAKRPSTIMKGYTGGNESKLHKGYQEDYREDYQENYHENSQEDYQEDYREDHRDDYQDDYRDDYQGDYQEGYKEGYQGSYQGSYQGDYQED